MTSWIRALDEQDGGDAALVLGALDAYRSLMLDNRGAAMSEAERISFEQEIQRIDGMVDQINEGA